MQVQELFDLSLNPLPDYFTPTPLPDYLTPTPLPGERG